MTSMNGYDRKCVKDKHIGHGAGSSRRFKRWLRDRMIFENNVRWKERKKDQEGEREIIYISHPH